jgi:hypothetical protein
MLKESTNLDPILRWPGQTIMVSARLRLPENETQTLNPGVPQPGLFPAVISLNASKALEYRSGFKNPRGGFFFEIRASFKSDTKPATVGQAADVPPTFPVRPLRKIRKPSACAETSGIAYVSH